MTKYFVNSKIIPESSQGTSYTLVPLSNLMNINDDIIGLLDDSMHLSTHEKELTRIIIKNHYIIVEL